MMKTCVVLPTYNEKENLEAIIKGVLENLPSAHIMVVDDNSPDGTGRIADELSQKNPHHISVLHREKKEGLGKAYLAGFQKVLEMGAEKIFQMDCDFSHPPSLLPKLSRMLEDYDLVLGSRYIPGGGTENWSFKRRLLSRLGNLYARVILGLPIRDLTGGYKAFHRRVLEYIIQSPIDSEGYNFQIEMTYRALLAGFTYKEIPFVFPERKHGESKMSKKIVWEAFLKTFRLRKLRKKNRRHLPLHSSNRPNF